MYQPTLFCTILCLPLLVVSLPHTPRTSSLTVTTSSGAFTGASASTIDSWLGIPYAKDPVGDLRFAAPVALVNPNSTAVAATAFGDACPQAPSDTQPVGATISEACLNLNVYRPAGTEDSAKLPILFWIYGGGFTNGAASQYNPSLIVAQSKAMGTPIMVVTINYRVNTFGFLSSDDFEPSDLNNGLRDQTLALQWVQTNIAAFGGDAEKVTIWGESAGAMSVGQHVLYSEPGLFRAGIMNSGTATGQSVPSPSYGKAAYDTFLADTNCTLSTPAERIACLRAAPYDLVQSASLAQRSLTLLGYSWAPVMGGPGSYITDRPSKRTAEGNYLKVPIISGTNLDEGTLFATSAATAPADAGDDYFKTYVAAVNTVYSSASITEDVYETLINLYPQDPTVGSPMAPETTPSGSPVFKRMAAFFGDVHFQAPRRYLTNATRSSQPTYVYHYTGPQPTTYPGYLGVYHSLDLSYCFGGLTTTGLSTDELAANNALGVAWRSYYINFVANLSPGDDWPAYQGSGNDVLQLTPGNISTVADDWRLPQTDYLSSQTALDAFLQRK